MNRDDFESRLLQIALLWDALVDDVCDGCVLPFSVAALAVTTSRPDDRTGWNELQFRLGSREVDFEVRDARRGCIGAVCKSDVPQLVIDITDHGT